MLRDYRESTRFSRPGADATMAIEALKTGDLSPPEVTARLKADLLDTYQARLQQELDAIEQAAQQNFAMCQAESVGLVYGYWLILKPAYEEQLGAVARQQADKAFDDLLALAYGQKSARLNPALAEIRNLLHHFWAAPLSAEEQARRAGQLLRFLSLVAVEYGRGVYEGQIILDFEIQEASTFLNGPKRLLRIYVYRSKSVIRPKRLNLKRYSSSSTGPCRPPIAKRRLSMRIRLQPM